MPKASDTTTKNSQNHAPSAPPAVAAEVMPDQLATAVEATYYLGGLFAEFRQQVDRYLALTEQFMTLEAQVELNEKTLCVVRDHFMMKIADTDSAKPHDWASVLNSVRFVGWRLADACVELLKEHQRMTAGEIIKGLNKGMFRFRSNAPLREIHAALLRHPSVKRDGDYWVWTGDRVDTSEIEPEEKKTVG